jgi:hypothetical protein
MNQSLIIPRPPFDLPQFDRNACITCLVANLLYMYGLTAEPDPGKVDRELGRQPGQPLTDTSAHIFSLLGKGFFLYEINSADHDRFVREGLGYLKERYQAQWTPEWDRLYTPEVVAQMQLSQEQCWATLAPYSASGQYRYETHDPTFADLERLMGSPGVCAAIYTHSSISGMVHASLVYSLKQRIKHPFIPEIEIYSPQRSHTSLQRNLPGDFNMNWVPREGITAIWRYV